jgi:outer membrane protein OmpA-like peptidoglycan-associated protein
MYNRPGIFRTYLYTRLLCSLEKGREYIFTASFRTPNNQSFAHADLLWLDFEPFHFQGRIAGASQRNTITQENKTKDLSMNWKAYSIRFVATGEEKYVIIGNFSKEIFPGKPQQKNMIVYEMDDVELVSADPSIRSCAERDTRKQELYAQNYRHTPGKFIDELEEDIVVVPKTQTPVEPVKKPDISRLVPVEPVTATNAVNDTLVIPDVLFKFDKSELNPVFAYRLDTLINKIKGRTFKRIEVLGHTDSFGKDEYNEKLSANRAITVKKYLIDHLQYAGENIITKGFGAEIPVSTNATSVGRQKNRRVEIVLIR